MTEETMDQQQETPQEAAETPQEAAETPQEAAETPQEATQEQEEDLSEEEAEKLPFPNATIVRIMKNTMDNEKMIKKEVKVAMNKWLGNLCTNVSKEMNKFPYVMMHLHEFQKATEQYTSMENFQKEKDRILAHMEAIKKDVEKLQRDLGMREEDVF